MKLNIVTLFIFSSFLLSNPCVAQDILPEFKLKLINKGNVLISWHNPFKNCSKLSVQRSSDHKNFKTIVEAKKPNLFENSFTDNKSPKNKNTFYRIQYTLKNGDINFSKIHSTLEKDIAHIKASSINPMPNWEASHFIFTNSNGNVQILLNNTSENIYRVVFQDENGKEIFQINKVVTDNSILDKSNFIHIGLFQFELYKNGDLVEKNKIYLKGN